MGFSFLTLAAVMEQTTLSRSELYRRIKAGTFPRAIILGPRTKAWDSREVQAWLEHAAATAPRERGEDPVSPDAPSPPSTPDEV